MSIAAVTRSPAPWVLALVVVAYAGSLSGGWVWDDHAILESNPALDDPAWLLTTDLFGPSGEPSDVYRPLVMLSFLPGHALGAGPLFERLLSLGLHLLGVSLLARWAQALGASVIAAWLGAALFGLHPGVSETVAWISGRQDLLPGVMLLGAGLAFAKEKPWVAGGLLALTPFAKESFLLAPLVFGVWMMGQRRVHPALGLPVLGVGAYLGLRALLDIPLPAGAAGVDPLGPAGAALERAVVLGIGFMADPLPLYEPAPALGALALLIGLTSIVAAWGRPRVAAAAAPLLLILPGVLAAAHTGLMSDRYLHAGFISAGLIAAAGLSRFAAPPRLAWVLPLGLTASTLMDASRWTDDLTLFQSSLRRTPDNDRAAYHVAHALQKYDDNCEDAAPLYARSLDADPRAPGNLLACLVELGRLEEAVSLAPEAIAATDKATPAANGARAAAALGRLKPAREWATEATRRAPDNPRHHVLLGNILGQQGELSAALAAFEAALALDPSTPGAAEGKAACLRGLAAREQP